MGRSQGRVGRNEPCPCGSGRKFKRCHGGGPGVQATLSKRDEEEVESLESLQLRIAADMQTRMDAMGLTRDDLCERLGLSRSRVDAVLDAGPGTMGDVVDVAAAVGCPLLEFFPGLGRFKDEAPR